MYSLVDGSLIRSIGSCGTAKGQFDFLYGGLCVSPDGDDVLVAEGWNGRIQQVRIADGSWVRFVGQGALSGPEFLDCNADVIVVSERRPRISVFSWADGSVRAQFGSFGSGPGKLNYPRGLRLLADGSGLVVADMDNHRLCVFALGGECVATIGCREMSLHNAYDVLEYTLDGSFIVSTGQNLTKLSRDDTGFEVFGTAGRGDGEFNSPTALAAIPDGGIVVREFHGERFHVFRGFELRKTWITVCVTLGRRNGDTAKRARVEGV